VNQACASCILGCSSCTIAASLGTADTQCDICKAGYCKVGSTCTKCPSGCDNCAVLGASMPMQCTDCRGGYSMTILGTSRCYNCNKQPLASCSLSSGAFGIVWFLLVQVMNFAPM
jgi:hypothetical protein